MAIKKDITHNSVFIPECYVKISSFGGDKNKIIAVVSLSATNSSDSFATSQFEFTPSLNDENFIAQAYNHLKSLPEYSGAIDC